MIIVKAVDGVGEQEPRVSKEEAYSLAALLAYEQKKDFGLYSDRGELIVSVNPMAWDSIFDSIIPDPAVDYLRASMRIDGKPSRIEILEHLAILEGEEIQQAPLRYLWYGDIHKELMIYVDDSHRFMLVYYHAQKVCSTIPEDLVFIPGEWWTLVEPHIDRIYKIILGVEKRQREEFTRQDLAVIGLL